MECGMFNVVSGYAPQVGCENEKEKFWLDLVEVVQGIPRYERVVIRADLNRHNGGESREDEEVIGDIDYIYWLTLQKIWQWH
jgi:hypothetical protein